jgi:tetrapyrrole methylase family protein/MazG family protein/ATP diphosphatase
MTMYREKEEWAMIYLDRTQASAAMFGKLVDLIRALRSETGCPWDKKQTLHSFHPYILEEYHEMVQAISHGDPHDIADEAGDLIFLVVFIAYLLEQDGGVSLSEILQGAITKMVRRHPHVFGDVTVRSAEDVVDNWAKIKASEENIKRRESFLDGIPRSLPALSRAQKLARRAARVGFDWTRPEEVLPKIDEELGELKEAIESKSRENIREELGDLLFVITNAARHLEVNSEAALNESSDKFERRFRYIEDRLKASGKSLEEASLEEMDRLWNEAKAMEKMIPPEEP